ncbi:MAG: SDR family oxidoreductase [Solirubrobacterales bacterium]|nr:SDR family oxidoreductase [Solirubrobacterales bacterium]
MDVVVIGGHGKIARRLLGLLIERGHGARGVIRNPDHAADLESLGAEPFICDLETEELTDAVAGADAVVFAAGAGPGSEPERKKTVDLGGAVKLIEACRANEISRYVMVSSINADHPGDWPEQMRPYFEAKAAADAELEKAGLAHTIVRPGSLSDEPGTAMVSAAPDSPYGVIPRDDVALVLAEVLEADNTIGKSFDVVSGETPVKAAVAAR